MGYIEKNLLSGERVVHQAKLHWKIFIPAFFFFIFAGYLFWIGNFVFWNILTVLGCLPLAIGAFLLGKSILRFRTEEYAVTTNTVILKKGIFTNRAKQIPLNHIEDIDVISPILGRIFGYGTLSYGSGSAKQDFKEISSPNEFWNKARQQLNNPESNDEVESPPPKPFWKILPEGVQVYLASLGVITADEPTEFGGPFGVYKETKLRQMNKLSSNAERISFMQKQVAEMDTEDDRGRMQQRRRMVRLLCQEIDERYYDDLDEEERELFRTVQEDSNEKEARLYRGL